MSYLIYSPNVYRVPISPQAQLLIFIISVHNNQVATRQRFQISVDFNGLSELILEIKSRFTGGSGLILKGGNHGDQIPLNNTVVMTNCTEVQSN